VRQCWRATLATPGEWACGGSQWRMGGICKSRFEGLTQHQTCV